MLDLIVGTVVLLRLTSLVSLVVTIVALFQKISWRRGIKHEAKNRLKEANVWLSFSGMILGVILIGLILNAVMTLFPFLGILGLIAQIAYIGIVSYNMVHVVHCVKRQKPFELKDFYDTSNLSSIMTLAFIQTLYLFLWSLLIIPFFVKRYSYSQTYYLMYDHPELATDDLITKSREMMNGQKWKLFVLDTSFIGWGILALFTFGIAGLYIAPVYVMARLSFYEYLKSGYVKSSDYQNVYYTN